MATLFNRKFFIFPALIAGYICIALTFASFFRQHNTKPVLIPKSEHNKPLGRIIAGTLFIQEMQMHNDFLCAIEIELATWNRTNNNRNKLVILDNAFTILQEIEFQSDSIKDNSFHSFNFKKPIEIGKDKHFFVCLLSEDGQDNNCITAWTDTVATTGKLYQESISKLGLQETVKIRKNLLKGSLQIKTIESEKTGFIMAFLFMFCLLGISTVLIYKLKANQTVRSIELILLIFFVISLLTPSLYFIFMQTEKKEKSNWEKRMLATKPVFDIRNLGEYLPQMQSFINDHIPFRNEIISCKAGFYYKYFIKSSFPNTSIVGKQGWFFRTREVATANGGRIISAEDIKKITGLLHERTRYYDSLGIKFYISIVPAKSEIYREFLPDYCKLDDTSGFSDGILNGLSRDTTLNLIDLKPILINAKKNGQIFYKTDMHWTAIGAYTAYCEILNRMNQDFPNLKPLDYRNINLIQGDKITSGDALELALDNVVKEQYSYLNINKALSKELPKANYYNPESFKHATEFEIVRGIEGSTLPKILVIRDSFFQALFGVMSENFSKSVYIWDNWKYGTNKKIVENEKPDIILMEAYIGFIPNILDAEN